MHKYFFMLDGKSSIDYGIFLQRPLTFSKPSRRYEEISIPGRNGVLHRSEDAFGPVTATAECFVLCDNAEESMGAAVSWILGVQGTRRLETPEDPGIFRTVTIYDGFDTDPRINRISAFTVQITACPERFMKSGERVMQMHNGGKLYNPGLASRPLIEVTGSGEGTVTAGGVTVNILDIPDTLMLDCDIQNAYNSFGDQNGKVSTPNGYPMIPSGTSAVSWSGGVAGVKITPRWWSL